MKTDLQRLNDVQEVLFRIRATAKATLKGVISMQYENIKYDCFEPSDIDTMLEVIMNQVDMAVERMDL